jgi:hypothetical protein
METYVIRKKSADLLLLVDRSKTRQFWWSYALKYAMRFSNKAAADRKAKSFKYGSFEVITYDQARKIRQRINKAHEEVVEQRFDPDANEHPFSCEGLGQWC